MKTLEELKLYMRSYRDRHLQEVNENLRRYRNKHKEDLKRRRDELPKKLIALQTWRNPADYKKS